MMMMMLILMMMITVPPQVHPHLCWIRSNFPVGMVGLQTFISYHDYMLSSYGHGHMAKWSASKYSHISIITCYLSSYHHDINVIISQWLVWQHALSCMSCKSCINLHELRWAGLSVICMRCVELYELCWAALVSFALPLKVEKTKMLFLLHNSSST